jgi:hypothetical protein
MVVWEQVGGAFYSYAFSFAPTFSVFSFFLSINFKPKQRYDDVSKLSNAENQNTF